MRITHKLTSILFLAASLFLFTAGALAADPGENAASFNANIDDLVPGPCLVYNLYASSAGNPASENTRISVTNYDDDEDVSVHFYYIDGDTCSVADNYICLTKNQTATVYASDVDPGVKGYIIAMATFENGRPNPNAQLVGNAYVKLASGHSAALNAMAIDCELAEEQPADASAGAIVHMDVPLVLGISTIPSPAEGNNGIVVLNSLNGDLRVAMNSIGSMFGLLFDQLENPYSYTFRAGCQLRQAIGGSFPRTTPRIASVIPAGAVGWTKFYSTSGNAVTGAFLNFNPNAGNSATAFNGGHNLNVFTLTDARVIFPIFPSNCGFVDILPGE